MILHYISQAEDLLNSGTGDQGRNEFILNSLNNGKKLYNTDMQYLQRMTQKLDDKIASLQSKPKISKTTISQEMSTITDKEIDEILEKQEQSAKKKNMPSKITTKISLKSKFKKMFSK